MPDMRPDFHHAAADVLRLHQGAWLRAAREGEFARAHERIEERKKKDEGEQLEATDVLHLAMVMASHGDLAQFGERLFQHDHAVVEALMENAEKLDQSREKVDGLLGQAHVLNDGRRVFKTEDGLQVFDEHGSAVAGDVVAPDEIADSRPRWETYQSAKAGYDALVAERQELLTYQERLDEVRARLDRGNVTEAELAGFEALLDEAPAAVQEKVAAHGVDGPDATMATAAPGHVINRDTIAPELDLDL